MLADHGAQGGYLRGLLTAGVGASLGEPVESISRTGAGVQVRTTKRVIDAEAAIVTIPLAVIEAGAIVLEPPLSGPQTEALARIGVSKEMKTFITYAETGWSSDHQIVGLPNSPYFDFFINLAAVKARPAIRALSAGAKMERARAETSDHLGKALSDEARRVFGDGIGEPTSVLVSDFSSDPYSLGCWSHGTLASLGDEQTILCQPIGGRILLAGEGTSHRYGFVDGAWHDGQRAAQLIIDASRGG